MAARVPTLAAVEVGPATPAVAPAAARCEEPAGRVEEAYAALVLGTRDYVRKNGFGDVVIGLSGGIDSTLVALLAADALGPERVRTATMPSRYTSDGTYSDAHEFARRLGVEILELPIEGPLAAFEAALASRSQGASPISPRRICRPASAARC